MEDVKPVQKSSYSGSVIRILLGYSFLYLAVGYAKPEWDMLSTIIWKSVCYSGVLFLFSFLISKNWIRRIRDFSWLLIILTSFDLAVAVYFTPTEKEKEEVLEQVTNKRPKGFESRILRYREIADGYNFYQSMYVKFMKPLTPNHLSEDLKQIDMAISTNEIYDGIYRGLYDSLSSDFNSIENLKKNTDFQNNWQYAELERKNLFRTELERLKLFRDYLVFLNKHKSSYSYIDGKVIPNQQIKSQVFKYSEDISRLAEQSEVHSKNFNSRKNTVQGTLSTIP